MLFSRGRLSGLFSSAVVVISARLSSWRVAGGCHTSSTAEPNRKTHKNKFAGLRLDEGEVVPVENFPTLGATGHIDGSMIPAMETKSVLSGWSKVAAKPAAKSTSAHVSAFVENDRFEWGAESEVEDEPETTNMVDWPL